MRVAERELLVDLVVVAASVAALAQVPRLLEVVDDLRHGALGSPDRLRDVLEPSRRVGGDDLEHVGVVCNESERLIIVTGT